MQKISYEIKNCVSCPFFRAEQLETSCSWDIYRYNWYCGKSENKLIVENVGLAHDQPIPDWCEILIKS